MQYLFAWRYFKSKKSTSAINIIAWVSVTAIAVGAAALIVILSVFNGFEDLVKGLYTDFYADMRVLPAQGKKMNLDSSTLYKIQSIQGVTDVSKVIEEKALLANGDYQSIVLVKGVDAIFTKTNNIKTHIVRGNYAIGDLQNPGIVMGAGIENAVGADVTKGGFPLTLYTPNKGAGFDGVEIHAANGYLLDQFLQDKTNQRQDQYGGSIENRLRIVGEVIEAVAKVFPSDRIGIRLSPYGTFNDISDSDPVALFSAAIQKLNGYNLAYLHMIEPRSTSAGGGDQVFEDAPITSEMFRAAYQGKFLTAGGYDQAMGEKVLEEGLADAVAYGRLYISNPDLAERFQKNAPLNPYNRATFYGGQEAGYTDYPTL
mgnify:CR=1 FL=1